MDDEEARCLFTLLHARGYDEHRVEQGKTLMQYASCGQLQGVLLSPKARRFTRQDQEFYADPVSRDVYMKKDSARFWCMEAHALIVREWQPVSFADFLGNIDLHCPVLDHIPPTLPLRAALESSAAPGKISESFYQRIAHSICNMLGC